MNVPIADVFMMNTDMYISTLRSYIKAMGGDLEVIVKFPDGEVKISNFADQSQDVQPAA